MSPSTLPRADRITVDSVAICSSMNEAALDTLISRATIRAYKRNDVLFKHGAPAEKIHIVLEGWIQLTRDELDGSKTLVAVFSKGESLGEVSGLSGGRYIASAQAMSKVRSLEIEASLLFELMHACRESLRAGLAAIDRKLEELVGEVASLKKRTVRQRLAEFLLRSTDARKGPSQLRLPFDKALIAAKVGTSPENLSRTFAELRQFGVTLKGRNARIDDIAKLEELLRA